MFTYKIITSDLYQHLQRHSGKYLHEIESLIKKNFQLKQEIQKLNNLVHTAPIQLQQKNQELLRNQQKILSLQSSLQSMKQKLRFLFQKQKVLQETMNETTNRYDLLLKQKQNLNILYEESTNKIQQLEQVERIKDQKIQIQQKNLQFLNKKVFQMQEMIKSQKLQKEQMRLILNIKIVTIQNLNAQIQKIKDLAQSQTLEIQKLNLEIAQAKQLIQKTTLENQNLKQQKIILDKQVQQFKSSPVAQLQQKLNVKQNWILELTQTINQLKQKNIYLQMQRQNTSYPYPLRPAHNILQSKNNEPIDIIKSKVEQAERFKYLTICKQFLHQFSMKMKKIQQQKKSLEEKYQTIKLKLNQYQYKQFKYKDKLSLYLQKIQRYEKLTEKQQHQMERFISQFDSELNKIIKMKQQQAQQKVQYQIFKYQQELEREKEEQIKRIKRQQLSSLKNYQLQELGQQQQQVREQQKYQGKRKSNKLENFKRFQQRQIQAKQNHFQPKYSGQEEEGSIDDFDTQILKKQLQLVKKDLQKYQFSKRKYKHKTTKLQNQCERYSTQARRYRDLVQQLIKQLQIKSNQNEILKSNLALNTSKPSSGNRSNQFGTSRLTNGQQFYENLSTRLSGRNQNNNGNRSGSDRYQYQISEIDTDLQLKNNFLLNKMLLNKYQSDKKGPAFPQNLVDKRKTQNRDKNDQFNESSISNTSSQGKNSQQSYNSSSNSSYQSKNSYKSYGIKNLYKQKQFNNSNQYHRYLLHKNSLQ